MIRVCQWRYQIASFVRWKQPKVLQSSIHNDINLRKQQILTLEKLELANTVYQKQLMIQ